MLQFQTEKITNVLHVITLIAARRLMIRANASTCSYLDKKLFISLDTKSNHKNTIWQVHVFNEHFEAPDVATWSVNFSIQTGWMVWDFRRTLRAWSTCSEPVSPCWVYLAVGTGWSVTRGSSEVYLFFHFHLKRKQESLSVEGQPHATKCRGPEVCLWYGKGVPCDPLQNAIMWSYGDPPVNRHDWKHHLPANYICKRCGPFMHGYLGLSKSITNTFVPFQLLMQNWMRKWHFPLNFRTWHTLSSSLRDHLFDITEWRFRTPQSCRLASTLYYHV